METMAQAWARLNAESSAAYSANPFSALSRDAFARYWRDPSVAVGTDETAVEAGWTIRVARDATLASRVAVDLADFLTRPMGVPIRVERDDTESPASRTIALLEHGGGDPAVAESFTIDAGADRITVRGRDAAGLRDGVVKLVEIMGLRRAPLVPRGSRVYRPRLSVRVGSVPYLGTQREAVFLGYNAVFLPGPHLYAISTSDALPELFDRRQPGELEKLADAQRKADEYGLRTYVILHTTRKFPKDHPLFRTHPDVRGALTWNADGEYTMCTEHPLVRRWYEESVEGVFRAVPGLDGAVVIIGGEGFYHCFMRPHGVEKGHTNCPRCEKLGPETVVANQLNRCAAAARRANPDARIIAWPYSAEHVWSIDRAQVPMIERMGEGTALFSEMEKDEYVTTPEGVRKHLWDYSIHLVGPGERAARQIEACRRVGIPSYMKSEPELAFEAPRLPHVPCMDLWLRRAEALASCGADGAMVFPAFRALYGTSAAESYKLVWWTPEGADDAERSHEQILQRFAARIAGGGGGQHLRRAWRLVSEAIPHSPEIPPYYQGPYYLGPAHPMCADAAAEIPQVFFGQYLFMSELTDEQGLRMRPTFFTHARGDVPVFLAAYRAMERLLARAAAEIDAAEKLVPAPARLMFDAEAIAVRWFYRTCRTHANFYESCHIRDRAAPMATNGDPNELARLLDRWGEVLRDERENTAAALPLAERDSRLDPHYGGDHRFSHMTDMLRGKLALLDHEISVFLPGLRAGRPARSRAAAGSADV